MSSPRDTGTSAQEGRLIVDAGLKKSKRKQFLQKSIKKVVDGKGGCGKKKDGKGGINPFAGGGSTPGSAIPGFTGGVSNKPSSMPSYSLMGSQLGMPSQVAPAAGASPQGAPQGMPSSGAAPSAPSTPFAANFAPMVPSAKRGTGVGKSMGRGAHGLKMPGAMKNLKKLKGFKMPKSPKTSFKSPF